MFLLDYTINKPKCSLAYCCIVFVVCGEKGGGASIAIYFVVISIHNFITISTEPFRNT
jgi:hypothetical protein